MTHSNLHYDALLVLSYGGPEGEDDVIPFLRNATGGRNIPEERLREVGEHYYANGGKSPINDQCKAMISNLEAELERRGIQLPIYYGTRNWHPYVEDVAAQMSRDGIKNALVFATSAWGGYSASRQYDEDIVRAREHLAKEGLPEINFTKLRQFFNHPAFVQEMADGIREAYNEFSSEELPHVRMIFTAHSVPLSKGHNDGTGATESEHYEAQVYEAAKLVADVAGVTDYDVVWQSRSGAPHIPWLEPDVVDHVEAVHEEDGLRACVVTPIGFLTDHMEVMWDLDTELRDACLERDIHMVRSRTTGLTAHFAGMLADLIAEANGDKEIERLGDMDSWGATYNGLPIDSYPHA